MIVAINIDLIVKIELSLVVCITYLPLLVILSKIKSRLRSKLIVR